MGWLGDSLGEPRENGCICAYILIPIIGGPLLTILAVGWGIVQVVS